MRRACLAALVFTAVTCHAQDPWSRADLAREGAMCATTLVDWGQTLDIEHYSRAWECNSIMGRHPTRGDINRYFASSLLIHAGIVWLLPAKLRPYFQYASIGVELAVTTHNARFGLRITF